MSAITVRLDPTTAKHHLYVRRGIPSCICGVTWPTGRVFGITEHLVEANAPLIEAQVRAQAAADIEAGRRWLPRSPSLAYEDGQRDGMTRAAQIAREGRP